MNACSTNTQEIEAGGSQLLHGRLFKTSLGYISETCFKKQNKQTNKNMDYIIFKVHLRFYAL
jgi:hypothetical protein